MHSSRDMLSHTNLKIKSPRLRGEAKTPRIRSLLSSHTYLNGKIYPSLAVLQATSIPEERFYLCDDPQFTLVLGRV